MTAKPEAAAVIREIVGTFADRAHFQAAVDRLYAHGFDRTALSVLSSHESIDVAQFHPGKSWKDVLTTLVGELKYEGPLVAAGLIALAAGPVGATIAALLAAGVGGAALKELLDEISALPNSEEFAKALEAGSVILWVAVTDKPEEEKVRRILNEAAAQNIHVFERKQS